MNKIKLFSVVIFIAAFGAWGRTEAKKPLLLISIDGVKPNYLSAIKSPHLWAFAHSGIRAKSMKPAFPSLTFPNHFTIVTGLYPENHGIVANEIHDPNIAERFSLGAPKEVVNDPRWWKGEPIWVTAQKQGLKSGTLFWPGSEAPIQNIKPTYFLPYDINMTNADRVKQLLKWIDLPETDRPQFYTLYIDTVDTAGHHFGPNSVEVANSMKAADDDLGILFNELQARNILDTMNIIIVSDHGMVDTPDEKRVNLSDVLREFPNIEKVGSGALAGFFSSDAELLARLQTRLAAASSLYKIYKKKDIPTAYHYQNSDRIPDLLLVANEGTSISLKPEFMRTSSPLKATHGYDNTLGSMQAIFIGHGPNFLEGLKVNSFENINIYALMCKLLGITPSPNDGKLKNLPKMLRTATN